MYYVVYGVLYLVSLLPWRVLYLLSDAVYGLLYYVVGYRRKVVMHNLSIAFPEKTMAERTRIAKDFYHGFLDTFVEMIKLLSISEAEMRRRVTGNVEVMNEVYASGKNVQTMLGHNFNWEMANLFMSITCRFPFVVVYMPVKNPAFNRLILKLRQRFGALLVSATDFRRQFRQQAAQRYSLTLVADQNPGNPGSAYWLPFFGKMTPFLAGPEKGARSANDAVLLGHITRQKRGHYRIHLQMLTTEPRSLPEGDITKKFVAFLEDAIRQNPANYLWSHRRFKWEYSEEYARRRIG